MNPTNQASSSPPSPSSTDGWPEAVRRVLVDNHALSVLISDFVGWYDSNNSGSSSNSSSDESIAADSNFDPHAHAYSRNRSSDYDSGSVSSEEEAGPIGPPAPVPSGPGQVVRRSPRLERPRGYPVQYRTINHRGQTFHIPLYEPSYPRYNGFDTLPADWYMGYNDEEDY